MLAGGQSLVPMLALRLAALRAPRRHQPGRRARTASSATTARSRIGAMTRQATRRARRRRSPTAVPLLARATPLIGHFQIRNRGTVGGSIAHADPAAEYPAVALALDAELEVASARRHRGRSRPPSSSPASGRPRSSADELLVGVRFPVWAGRCGFARRGGRPPPRRLRPRRRRRRGRARRRRPRRAMRPSRSSASGPTPVRRTRPPRPRSSARRADRRPTLDEIGRLAAADLDPPSRHPRVGASTGSASVRTSSATRLGARAVEEARRG